MIKISVVCPHPGFHLDEVCEKVLGDLYGGNKISIAPDAKLIPCQLQGTEDEWLVKGYLPLGQLGGNFDDKDPQTGQRKAGTCGAFEMARYLGVDTLPELQKLLKAVNRVDGSATANCSDLSSLVKNAVESFPEQMHPAIFRWAEVGVKAIIGYLKSPNDKCDDFLSPVIFLEKMIADGDIAEERVQGRLRRMVRSSHTQIGNCLELSFIMRAMKVTGMSEDDSSEWLFFALAKCASQQLDYYAAIEEIKHNGRVFELNVFRDGHKLKGVLIHSDNLQITKASRSQEFKYSVCIVRRSSGNVAITLNNYDNLDPRLLWALVRAQELPIELRRDVDFGEASKPGNHVVPNWYVMENGTILNGSNFIKAQPTRISDNTLINLVRDAFGEAGNRLYSHMTGMPVIREVRKPVNLPEFLQTTASVDLNFVDRRSIENSFDAGLRA